jgi:hypothetical protein
MSQALSQEAPWGRAKKYYSRAGKSVEIVALLSAKKVFKIMKDL